MNQIKIVVVRFLIVAIVISSCFACQSAEKPSEANPVETKAAQPAEPAEESVTYEPQYTPDNPPKESLDPFTPQDDFEKLVQVSKNKSDFDFNFEGYVDGASKYALREGAIAFDLKGTLRTGLNLEENVDLAISFYDNNQVSFTQRRKHSEFVLPYKKEKAKTGTTDKNLYSFDFSKRLGVERGVYYFVIAPSGRNRVLHTGKFLVN